MAAEIIPANSLDAVPLRCFHTPPLGSSEGLHIRDFSLAFAFLVGAVLLVGGCLYCETLFSAAGTAIGCGLMLCFVAAFATDRIELDMIL